MKTEYFLFVHHTKSILAKLRTWCFEHSGEISYSLLVNPSHTDESWEERHTCVCVCVCVYIQICPQKHLIHISQIFRKKQKLTFHSDVSHFTAFLNYRERYRYRYIGKSHIYKGTYILYIYTCMYICITYNIIYRYIYDIYIRQVSQVLVPR